jgi:poly(3-hydroxyoctanoate) depolymerase
VSPAITKFVRTAGLRLRVHREGDGPPLLLINGLGAPLEMWGPLRRELPGHELIAFDLPGSGLSATSLLPLGMRSLAEIAEAVMNEAGHRHAHVLGYSLGGLVAQELAYRSPESVDRLVLCATTFGQFSVPPRPLAAWLMLTPSRYHTSFAARLIVPLISGGRTSRDEDVLEAHLPLRLSHPPSVLGYVHQVYAAWGFTSQLWIRRLTQRTLVLSGDDDPVVPVSNARLLARAIPAATLEVLAGAGHLLLIDEAKTAGRRITDFLADAAAPSRASRPV